MNSKMKITEIKVKVSELAQGYEDNAENGVVAWNKKLDVRPAYQREFVYDEKKRNAVIDTLIKGYPLNIMYWAKNADDSYEIIDGQQRTISICQFLNNEFSFNNRIFSGMTQSEKDEINSYELTVFVCEGNDKEKLDWFETINIAGEELEKQELRNAVYTGKWLSDAKRYFSKTNCAAYNIASKYLAGELKRQKYLETAIRWHANAKTDDEIRAYMGAHQMDSDALELWSYFQNVIGWVKAKFKVYRKEMKGIEWGFIYNRFDEKTRNSFDAEKIEADLKKYFGYEYEDQITNKKGIFEYVLDGDERHLNIRAFKESEKRAAYENQNGICVKCGNHFEYDEMEGDHIKPWSKGGKTELSNLQLLCRDCNRRKSDR
jgi:hypothetical protein